MSVFLAWLSLLVIYAPNSSHAQTQLTLPLPKTSEEPNPAQNVTRSVFGQIRLENLQYLTSIPESPNLTRSQFLSGRLSMTSLSESPWSFDYVADVIAGTFFSQRQTHWMVNELSMSTLLNTNLRTSVGRKKYDWNELDQYWQTSLWQPQYSIDALRPEAQGLTGLFFDMDTEKLQVLGFYTPVFIPTVGAEIREENGGLVSDSRWYKAPSQTINLGNNANSISYRLDVPDRVKLIDNWGEGLLVRVGTKSSGPWMVLAAADKPVNDLVLSRNITVGINTEGVVIVEPDVVRHYIWSSDIGYSFESVKVIFSYLADRPHVKLPKAEWATQKLLPLQAYSGIIDLSLAGLVSRPLQVQVGYLKVFGGGIEDIESDGQKSDFTLLDTRLRFTNTFSAKAQGSFFNISNRPLITKVFYFYDWDQLGSLTGLEFQYLWSPTWTLLAGADFLGADESTDKPNGFLNQFRANDRVYGGLSYVF